VTQIGDSISVECACGKKLKAPASAVGRKAKCPKCGNVMTITAPPPPPVEDDALGALYDLASEEKHASSSDTVDDSPRCPKCAASMNVGDVLCVNCGYDLRTKSKLAAKPVVTKPVIDLDAASSASKKRKDKMAPEGSFLVGLLTSAGLGLVGGIIWFFITWGTGLDIYIVCLLIGILAGVGMQIGQKGFSTAGGWAAAGVSLVVLLLARLAVVIAILIPMIAKRVEANRAKQAAQLSSATLAKSTSGVKSAPASTPPRLSASNTTTPNVASTTPHHSVSHALGALVILLLFFGWKSTIFMILTLGIAYRTASGSVSG
jgi:predicted lipid-binding transport protein (Tim44 family)